MNKTLKPTFVEMSLPAERVLRTTPNFPVPAEDEYIKLLVNIKTAKVENWKSEYGYVELFAKIVDEGIYRILDEDMKELDKLEDYVPNALIPEHDGYGDYITMRISRSGYVTNWYKQPQLTDFNLDFDEIERIFNEEA